jgi:hypothetical protein
MQVVSLENCDIKLSTEKGYSINDYISTVDDMIDLEIM